MQSLRYESASGPDRRTADWDIRAGPKNYLALVSAQVASAILSLAAVWLATRLLGPTGYGWIVGLIAASQAIAQLTVNWTAVSVARYGVEEFVETGLVARAFWTRFWIFVPNVLMVLATSPLWLPFITSLLKLPPGAYVLIIGNLLATSFWVHIQTALQGAKLMRLQGSLLAFERVLVFSIISGTALIGKATFTAIAMAYILSPLLIGAIALWRIRAYVLPIRWVDDILLRRMLRFSWPVLPASLVGYLSTNYLDAFFITHYLSSADLAVYAVAYQVSGMALQFPLLAGSLLLPLFVTLEVGGPDNRAKRFILDVLPVLSVLWGTACSLAAALAGYLLPLIFGAEFRTLATLLWPLMVASTWAGPVLMGYAPFSNARSATYIVMIAATTSAVLNVSCNYLLVPRLGLIGCAWSTAIAGAGYLLVIVLLVHSRLLIANTWIVQALIPMTVGAAFASLFGWSAKAVAATVLMSAVLLLFHRKSVGSVIQVLNAYRNRTVPQIPV